MTLFEISREIDECFDPETGEIFEDKLKALEMERDTKIENIACWIKNLDAEAKAIREEEKNLAERRNKKENKAESLRTFLSNYLCGAKFESAKVKIGYRKSEQISVDLAAVIPEQFYSYEPKLKKDELKKAVKAGLEVSGVEIIEKQNIQIK